MQIITAAAPAHFDAARALFREYSGKLGVSLCFQGFEQELTALESMYAAPGGALLLLEDQRAFPGCVGVRPLGGECEMKRLYVQYLDTLPSMTAARALYAAMGFMPTAPYYMNPIEGVTYMVKELRP
jgi:hypothetical protein